MQCMWHANMRCVISHSAFSASHSEPTQRKLTLPACFHASRAACTTTGRRRRTASRSATRSLSRTACGWTGHVGGRGMWVDGALGMCPCAHVSWCLTALASHLVERLSRRLGRRRSTAAWAIGPWSLRSGVCFWCFVVLTESGAPPPPERHGGRHVMHVCCTARLQVLHGPAGADGRQVARGRVSAGIGKRVTARSQGRVRAGSQG